VIHQYLDSRGLPPDRVIPAWRLREERGRMVIPYLGWSGLEVGWSGRALSDDLQPKYLNSTGLQRKRWLFGLHQERQTFIPVLTEGQVDAIALWSLGYTCYAVAGSELSLIQAAHIAGITDVCIIFPDQPKPGSPVLAEKWTHNLSRMSVTSVFPQKAWPDDVEKADPAWLMQNRREFLIEQIECAMLEAERWRRMR
jgi:DNA primase